MRARLKCREGIFSDFTLTNNGATYHGKGIPCLGMDMGFMPRHGRKMEYCLT